MKKFQSHLRKEYKGNLLIPSKMNGNPFLELKKWYSSAEKAKIPEPNAAALATASKNGAPSCRFVLVKGFEPNGLVFFTNYKSRKASELSKNPRAAITCYWQKQSRQVRLEGRIEKIDSKHSDKYFQSRPVGARIAAAASPQSQEIPSLAWLQKRFEAIAKLNHGVVERPAHWGGYRLIPTKIEFWQGQENRLHNRVLYQNISGRWRKKVLAP